MTFCRFTTDDIQSDIYLRFSNDSYWLSLVDGSEYRYLNPYDVWKMLDHLKGKGFHIPEVAYDQLRPIVLAYAERNIKIWRERIGSDIEAMEKIGWFGRMKLEMMGGIV